MVNHTKGQPSLQSGIKKPPKTPSKVTRNNSKDPVSSQKAPSYYSRKLSMSSMSISNQRPKASRNRSKDPVSSQKVSRNIGKESSERRKAYGVKLVSGPALMKKKPVSALITESAGVGPSQNQNAAASGERAASSAGGQQAAHHKKNLSLLQL